MGNGRNGKVTALSYDKSLGLKQVHLSQMTEAETGKH